MIIFPDSNIFAHFKSIETWDWQALIGKPIKLGLSMVIIGELDKIKNSANSNQVKQRVRENLKKFKESVNKELNGTPFFNYNFKWNDQFRSDYNMEQDNKDDMFLASVLKYREENPRSELLVVSDDYAVQIKCESYNIPFLEVPEEYLIKEESKDAKEIKRLTNELRILQNRQPVIDLQFTNAKKVIEFSIERPDLGFKKELTEKMAVIKKEVPLLQADPEPRDEATTNLNRLLRTGFSLFPKTPEKVVNYNAALTTYYSNYEAYLKKQMFEFYKSKLTIRLDIEMINTGTEPADDIDLYMHFPNGFTLSDKKGKRNDFGEPSPPELSDFGLGLPTITLPSMPSMPFSYPQTINVSHFSIKKTNSYEVKDHFSRLKHFDKVSTNPIYLTFDRFEDIISFKIDFEITVANMISKKIGRLNVVINRINQK